jgi:hypothetical protein
VGESGRRIAALQPGRADDIRAAQSPSSGSPRQWRPRTRPSRRFFTRICIGIPTS